MRAFLLNVAVTVIVSMCAHVSSVVADEKSTPQSDPQELYKLLDTNKDGKLSVEEFSAKAIEKPKPEEKEKLKTQLQAAFKRLDTNKDGSV